MCKKLKLTMSKRNHTFSGTIRYYLVIGSLFFLSTCTEDKPTKPNSKTPNSKQKLFFDQKKVEALFGNGKLDEALRRGTHVLVLNNLLASKPS